METVCSSATLVPTYKTTQCYNQHNRMNVHRFKTSDINIQVSGIYIYKKRGTNYWISIYLSALHLRNVQTNGYCSKSPLNVGVAFPTVATYRATM